MNLLERNREQYELRQRIQKARFEIEFCHERIQYLYCQYQEQFEPDLFEMLLKSSEAD